MATIEQRGPYQWRAKVRRKGYPIQSKTFDYKADAEAWARDVERDMDHGIFVDRSKAETETLHDLIERYLKEETPRHKGAQAEELRLKKILRDEKDMCAYAMSNLRPEHVEDWRDRRLGEVKPGTVKRELNLLHCVIEHSRRRLELRENPVSHVKRPQVRDERLTRISKDEEKALMKALDDCRNDYIKSAVVIALETTMRRGELLSLNWDDVDLDGKEAKLHDTKNGETRDVGLSRRALVELRKLKRERDKTDADTRDQRVFPISAESLKNAWERARKRAGLEHINFHDLRHESISRLIEAGISPAVVQRISGHRDPKSMMRYVKLRGSDLAKVIDDSKGRISSLL